MNVNTLKHQFDTNLLHKQIRNELSNQIKGELYLDEVSRILWSTDASMYQIMPIAVVTPLDTSDVIKTIKFCHKYQLPVTPRGGGAGLCGAAIGPGIIIDFTKHMSNMIEINQQDKYFRVQPGRKLAPIQKELASFGLFLPPDPASAEFCTIGGNIGTNAGGSHSVKYGLMASYTLSLKVVLSNGELITTQPFDLNDPKYIQIKEANTLEGNIYREIEKTYLKNTTLINTVYPDVKYNIAGYELRNLIINNTIDLTRLFVGSEGSLGTTVEIKMKILPLPKYTTLLIAYFNNAIDMGKATWKALQQDPSAVELMDYRLVKVLRQRRESLVRQLPQEMQYLLMIEFDGNDKNILDKQAELLGSQLIQEHLAFEIQLATSEQEIEEFWTIRKLALPLLGQINDNGRRIVPVIEDVAVPPQFLAEYLEKIIDSMDENKIPFAMYGHAGKGLIHIRPLVNLQHKDDIQAMVNIANDSFQYSKQFNGTVSGEHGDGRVRTPYIRQQYGDEMYSLFIQVKELFDPQYLMNPDIKISDKSITDDLRYTNYQRIDGFNSGLLIHFQPAEWEDTIEHCNGCSRCTNTLNTVNMCPIYKVTKEETATPKSKANSLRALISGKLQKDQALKSPVMKELIFNCTGCQSCITDCPASVNIPKIALQFKAEYVEHNGQSLGEYLLGSIGLIGAKLRLFVGFINITGKWKITGYINEKVFGITRYRKLPRFHRTTFMKWFDKHENQIINPVRKVAYFAGCTASYNTPDIGKSMIQVLERNNIEVVVPNQKCCGLPMYTYGNVKRASAYAQYSIDNFLPYIEQGYDILVTCSSCGLSLKQEWFDLLGNEQSKKIANATYHFSEYLLLLKNEGLLNQDFNEVNLNLGYHTPCHLRVQPDAKTSSIELLNFIPGITIQDIQQGCCGICGSWGYKKDNYQKSMKIGENLFLKLNQEHIDLGITDCPTCTLQMEHGSTKQIQHPVQILAKSYEKE
ncbi:MAG: anaerobic glycerol-3-phosphate dehydrogenase subunit C [Candidatus Heimdallarchaeota archaeon]|nr:anaerobic glycerol-3-phosphate dehydrogenase subunit C [Candidatus Heimdallarchaeota archaeon]